MSPAPKDTRGLPKDTRGLPKDTRGLPKDTDRLPKDTDRLSNSKWTKIVAHFIKNRKEGETLDVVLKRAAAFKQTGVKTAKNVKSKSRNTRKAK